MTFHQGGDMTVLGAAEEIAFQMTGNGTVPISVGLSRMEMASTI
jgi:hypothetical protein